MIQSRSCRAWGGLWGSKDPRGFKPVGLPQESLPWHARKAAELGQLPGPGVGKGKTKADSASFLARRRALASEGCSVGR